MNFRSLSMRAVHGRANRDTTLYDGSAHTHKSVQTLPHGDTRKIPGAYQAGTKGVPCIYQGVPRGASRVIPSGYRGGYLGCQGDTKGIPGFTTDIPWEYTGNTRGMPGVEIPGAHTAARGEGSGVHKMIFDIRRPLEILGAPRDHLKSFEII